MSYADAVAVKAPFDYADEVLVETPEEREAFEQLELAQTVKSEKWIIEHKGERFVFKRMVNDTVIEIYTPVSQAVAGIYAAAIVQGFQPPRCLTYLDKPAG